MVDIYSDESSSYLDLLKSNAAPVDVPEGSDVDPKLAGNIIKKEVGFGENFTTEFIQAYRRVGLESYVDHESEAYDQAYRELGAGGHLRAMGLQDIIPYGLSARQLYDINKDTIEKYINDNPQLNLKRPSDIESERLDKWKRDAEESQKNKDSNSFWSLGNLGAITGGLFGAVTDPINILLSVIPAGQLVKGGTIAAQLPKLFAEMTAVSAITSLESKPRDVNYRETILGETVDPSNLPKEVLAETLIGGAFGTALVGGGAALSKFSFGNGGKQMLAALEAKPNLTGAEQDALDQLRTIKDVMAHKPDDVPESDFVKKLANARAELETPEEVIANLTDKANYGAPLTPDESTYLNSVADPDNPFRFNNKASINQDVQQQLLPDEDVNVIINEFTSQSTSPESPNPLVTKLTENYKIEDIPAKDYFEAFKKEQSAIDELTACLNYVKPRVTAS